MRSLSPVFFLAASLSVAVPAQAADLSSGKPVPNGTPREPCVFTPQELAPIFGNFFEAGVAAHEDDGIETCTYKVTGSGEGVVVTIDSNNSPERFNRQRKSQTKGRSEAHNIFGVGDAGFSNGSLFAALKGNRSLEIKGFRTAAARKVQYEEGIELLRLGIGRMR